MIVVIFFLTAAFGALAWRDFRFALALLFGLLPTYLLRFSVGPLPSTGLEVLVITLGVIFAIRTWRSGRGMPLPYGQWRVAALMLFAAACFAASYSPNVFAALGVLKAYYVEPILVALMLVSTFTEGRDWQRAATALVVSGVTIAALAVAQHVTGLGIPAPWDIEARATSVFDFPNAVGLFVAPILSVLCVILSTIRTTRTRYVLGIAAVILVAGLVASATEAAFIAVPAALVLTLLLSRSHTGIKAGVVVGAVILTVAACTLSGTVREKLLLNDTSGQARVAMWHETAALLHDHPMLGAGLSGFPTAIAPYHDATFYEIFQYPHNILLNIWVELGMFGVLTALLIAALVGKTTWTHRNDPYVLAVFAALVTMAIHGLVDVPFFKNDLAILTAGFLAFLAAQKSR